MRDSGSRRRPSGLHLHALSTSYLLANTALINMQRVLVALMLGAAAAFQRAPIVRPPASHTTSLNSASLTCFWSAPPARPASDRAAVRPHRQPRNAESAKDCKSTGNKTQKHKSATSVRHGPFQILGAALPRIGAYPRDSHLPKGLTAAPRDSHLPP